MSRKILIMGGEGFREWGRLGSWAFLANEIPGVSYSRAGLLGVTPDLPFPSFGWGRKSGEAFFILRRIIRDQNRIGGYPQSVLISPDPADLVPFENNPARCLRSLLQNISEAGGWSPEQLNEFLRSSRLDRVLSRLEPPAAPIPGSASEALTIAEAVAAAVGDTSLKPGSILLTGIGEPILDAVDRVIAGIPEPLRLVPTFLVGGVPDLAREYGTTLLLSEQC